MKQGFAQFPQKIFSWDVRDYSSRCSLVANIKLHCSVRSNNDLSNWWSDSLAWIRHNQTLNICYNLCNWSLAWVSHVDGIFCLSWKTYVYLQKNRITDWSLKGLVEIIFSNPVLKQTHPEKIVQACVHCLTISKEGNRTTSQSNLCQCFMTLTTQKISWHSEENSCVCLCPLLLFLLLSTIQHLKFWIEKRWDL